MQTEVDFLVIGSGIAGMTFAIKAAKYGKVLLVSKSKLNDTGTQYAQGGIAAVMFDDENEVQAHIADTMTAGAGLSEKKIAEIVAREAKDRVKELLEWGVEFDKNTDGSFHLHLEGGHTKKRILHKKDRTGNEIIRSLRKKILSLSSIEVIEDSFAVDIITPHHIGKKVTKKEKDITCYGAYILDKKAKNVSVVQAKTTVLATGGSGRIYATTTNPKICTGDGVAMLYRAKGSIQNMEFYQFHPTALYDPSNKNTFLISEAVRGAGAYLINTKGERFMKNYDARLELASRDIVARAIDSEMKRHGSEYVCLDCRHIKKTVFQKKFPTIFKKLISLEIDPSKDFIPVIPAAHYQCGGITVDTNGKTSIQRLYAIGECAHTGLHGANRLASNSLLESVVYADRAVKSARKTLSKCLFRKDIPLWDKSGTAVPEELILISQSKREVQQIMSNYVGIVRSNVRLSRALKRLNVLYEEGETLYKKTTLSEEICELRNMINVSYLIIKFSMQRKKSIGLYYNTDLQ